LLNPAADERSNSAVDGVMIRLGVVSFLNARPLIEGLDKVEGVQCVFDVPAALPQRLAAGDVDAALVPVIDLLRCGGRFRVISDACIACDGETMTVRVFARVPPERIRTLWVDCDSHTSVALAVVLWRELFGRELALQPCQPRIDDLSAAEAVLLIGDKVVDPGRGHFAYEVDLGGAWREHTGLPFVFAAWACQCTPRCGQRAWPAGFPADEPTSSAAQQDRASADHLATLLSAARDRGVAQAAQIAVRDGPKHGWPVALAQRYLTRCLKFTLDASVVAGANRFARLCAAAGLVPPDAEILWPAALQARPVEAAR